MRSAREGECTLISYPGTADVKLQSGDPKCKNKADYEEIRCNVMVRAELPLGMTREVPAQVFAETDSSLKMDSGMACRTTLSGLWPNIEIDGWSCGSRHAVSDIVNCAPHIDWVDTEHRCGSTLAENKRVPCTVDNNHKVRIGNFKDLREDAESKLYWSMVATLILGSGAILSQCTVCCCCCNACRLVRQVDASKLINQPPEKEDTENGETEKNVIPVTVTGIEVEPDEIGRPTE